jgi:hypothetical protein
MNKEYLCTCFKTRARLNEEAIKAMAMTDEQFEDYRAAFEDYRAAEERAFKLNKRR